MRGGFRDVRQASCLVKEADVCHKEVEAPFMVEDCGEVVVAEKHRQLVLTEAAEEASKARICQLAGSRVEKVLRKGTRGGGGLSAAAMNSVLGQDTQLIGTGGSPGSQSRWKRVRNTDASG